MMVLLIDIDSVIPNLALAKIEKYHKDLGDEVIYNNPLKRFSADKIYVSCIFDWNNHLCDEWINDSEIGGSGYSLTKVLPPEIEAVEPKINMGFTTRGCIRNCLDGDTPINTINGMIPIKDLVGKEIGVWTYNPKTGESYITKASSIWFVDYKECIKVNFDDGSNIICTPDHRFLTFINGNQYGKTKEIVKYAENLKSGDSVIALKHYYDPKWGMKTSWRRKLIIDHIAVMEFQLGRKLKYGEVVHHLDGNRRNNLPENLALCKNDSEHISKYHSKDFSDRMKNDNPMKNNDTIEKVVSTRKIKYPKGTFTRTYEQRLNYRNSKLGSKNPNYKDGETAGRMSHVVEINHKVVFIEYIGKRKVYDMSVPETQWFFANNVLVHNCHFCIVPKKEGKIRVVGDIYNIWDGKSKNLIILDNNILALPEHFKIICEQLRKENLTVDFNQGLDCRLFDEDIANELKTISRRDVRFAFDDLSVYPSVVKCVNILKKFQIPDARWYVYTDENFESALERLLILKRLHQRTYVMRDRRIASQPKYIALARWSCTPQLFDKCDFYEFLKSYGTETKYISKVKEENFELFK